MTSSVGMGQKCCTASIRAATCTAVCSPTILCVSFEVPFGAVAVATLQTFVFLLSVHLHEMLVHTLGHIRRLLDCMGYSLCTL